MSLECGHAKMAKRRENGMESKKVNRRSGEWQMCVRELAVQVSPARPIQRRLSWRQCNCRVGGVPYGNWRTSEILMSLVRSCGLRLCTLGIQCNIDEQKRWRISSRRVVHRESQTGNEEDDEMRRHEWGGSHNRLMSNKDDRLMTSSLQIRIIWCCLTNLATILSNKKTHP